MNAKPTITRTSVVNAPVASVTDVALVVAFSAVLVVRRGVRRVLVSEAKISVVGVADTVVVVTVGVMLVSFTVRRNSGQSTTKSLPWTNNGSFVFPYT